ncbi:hypothetical protein CHS0354_015571, partial [Potamilus streckersoni]
MEGDAGKKTNAKAEGNMRSKRNNLKSVEVQPRNGRDIFDQSEVGEINEKMIDETVII